MGRFGQRGTGSHLRPSGLEIEVEEGMCMCAPGRVAWRVW